MRIEEENYLKLVLKKAAKKYAEAGRQCKRYGEHE